MLVSRRVSLWILNPTNCGIFCSCWGARDCCQMTLTEGFKMSLVKVHRIYIYIYYIYIICILRRYNEAQAFSGQKTRIEFEVSGQKNGISAYHLHYPCDSRWLQTNSLFLLVTHDPMIMRTNIVLRGEESFGPKSAWRISSNTFLQTWNFRSFWGEHQQKETTYNGSLFGNEFRTNASLKTELRLLRGLYHFLHFLFRSIIAVDLPQRQPRSNTGAIWVNIGFVPG